jgi:predicted dehydrogenase
MPGPAIKLGLIGAGRWGRNIIRTIAGLPDARLAAIASRNPATASLVPDDCRIVTDWRALIDLNDIDGVIIAGPPATHAEMLIAAIGRNRPALVEKPVVTTRVDVQRLRALLDGAETTILVDHTHLFHPAFRALQREAARLGPIRSIASAAGNRGPYRTDVSVLWDWAPHDIAMCLALVPGRCGAARATRLESRPVDGAMAETLALELTLAGGVPAHIRLSTLDERHRWFAVRFDAGTLVYRDQGAAQLTRLAPGADLQSRGTALPVTDEPPLTRAIRDFVQAVRSGDRDRGSIELGLAVVEVILRIEQTLDRPAG